MDRARCPRPGQVACLCLVWGPPLPLRCWVRPGGGAGASPGEGGGNQVSGGCSCPLSPPTPQEDEVVLQCTTTVLKEQLKLCLAAEGFGNRLCSLEPTSNAQVSLAPPPALAMPR